ncbi:MAG: phosphatidylserine decarboxylase [Pseudomonadota bacterium]
MAYRVYEEVYPILTLSIIMMIIGYLIHIYLFYIAFVVMVISLFMFRDPIRVTPVNNNIIVAPCDGYISNIEKIMQPCNVSKYNIQSDYYKISFHIGFLNVQLNYMPISGKIIDMQYYIFFPQKNMIVLKTLGGDIVMVTQVATFLTYDIICDVSLEQEINSGERIGMIKMGNTVELYIPAKFKLMLQVGQSCIGGESIIAIKDEGQEGKIDYKVQ